MSAGILLCCIFCVGTYFHKFRKRKNEKAIPIYLERNLTSKQDLNNKDTVSYRRNLTRTNLDNPEISFYGNEHEFAKPNIMRHMNKADIVPDLRRSYSRRSFDSYDNNKINFQTRTPEKRLRTYAYEDYSCNDSQYEDYRSYRNKPNRRGLSFTDQRPIKYRNINYY